VDFVGALPPLTQNYTPSVELNPVSPAATEDIVRGEKAKLIADVDINIPETGLKRPDMCVVIITNTAFRPQDAGHKDRGCRQAAIVGFARIT